MNTTTSSGLIMGGVSFLASLTLGILFPLCSPFCGAVWGGIAGVLAIVRWRDKEALASPAREGAKAGAIAGAGAFAGLMTGMIVSFGYLGGIESATVLYEELSRNMGIPLVASETMAVQQWLGAMSIGCCVGLVGLAIQTGGGVLGAQIFASRLPKSIENGA